MGVKMSDLILLAMALPMDAFAVSLGLGAKQRKHTVLIAILAGVYFGVFQGMMPLLGYLSGRSVLGFIENIAPWIACVILLGLGGKMLYEAFSKDQDDDKNDGDDETKPPMSQKTMLMLAVATSIDAIVAGVTLNLTPITPWLACAIIAVVTGVLSFVGVFLGSQSGTWLESKAEIFGGFVLMFVGLKMVLLN